MEATVKAFGARMVPAQTAPLLYMFQYGAAASLVSGPGRWLLGSVRTNRVPLRATNSRAGCGKSLPEMPASSEPSRKNMGRIVAGAHHAISSGVRATTFSGRNSAGQL